MEPQPNSLQRALDVVPMNKKVTGVAAVIEITAYPDGHAAIAGHPLNGEDELLVSVQYLFDRLQKEASARQEA